MSFFDLRQIQDISLKWKLLIPFLFFALMGTTILVAIGLTSQQKVIEGEEKREMVHYYQLFLEQLNQKKIQSVSLASIVAENPQVCGLVAQGNRQALLDLLNPTYLKLKDAYQIAQFQFHLPPAISFLRLHRPQQYGDDMGEYRKTILEVHHLGEAVAGLERGATGFGIRGVVPLYYRGDMVGTVEIGHSFGKAFLKELQRSWGIDLAIYDIKGKGNYELVARAAQREEAPPVTPFLRDLRPGETTIMIAPESLPDRSLLVGPVKDYSGRVVAMVEIKVDRSETLDRLVQTRNLMIGVGLAGIAISFFFTYLVAALFLRPIKEIVNEAHDIALGKRESRLGPRPNDEIGTLTQSLNRVLKVLKEKRKEIERHAKTLELRVEERTADLIASEEKYRALVENVPLIVYRVLLDGTTEFINSALTEILGYTIEEAVGDRHFWREKICGIDINTCEDIFYACFEEGEEYRTERLVRDKNGHILTILDHAIPAFYANGAVKWIDGIMMDITELKRLQERALLTEEIRILGEISAHMAHEIRNPLSTAGGFARRLRDSLPEDDPHRRQAGIIVEEVVKLENFLKILLSSIKPFDLDLKEIDVNGLIESLLTALEQSLTSKGLAFVRALSNDLPMIEADDERLKQAFEHILKHAIVSTPDGESIFISTRHLDDRLLITIRHRVRRLSEDDLEKFFFPHIEREEEWTILDLPLSKIIIHRHGGKVDLSREKDNILIMKMEFPIQQTKENRGVMTQVAPSSRERESDERGAF